MKSETGRMKSYFGAIKSAILANKTAGRELTVLPDDVFIVSYLRSGSTWARFLFGNLVQSEPVTFANVNRLVPMIYDFPDRVLRQGPRMLKSHECFDPRYPRIIHIVRDPRDVVVSFYFYNIKVRVLPEGYPIQKFVENWIKGKTVGYADRLGCWQDHTLSWIRMRQASPNYRLIRYEDLLSQPAVEIGKASSLLRMKFTPDQVERAVSLSSADKMRSLEKQQAQEWKTTRGTRQDIPFVRDAKSGNWRERLPSACVTQLEEAWGETIQQLGYEISSGPSAENISRGALV
jgi:hypothetical protein